MIAYSTTAIYNLFVREQAAEALDQQYLPQAEYDAILARYPVNFYSPNLFIRVGLLILTFVIQLFSFGIGVLLFQSLSDIFLAGLAIFFALLVYVALEYMVKTNKHFRSGVDDALLWGAAGALFGGISYITKAGDLANCILVFIIALYGAIRFADRLMSLTAYIALLGIVFFACIKLGPFVKNFLPFVVMGISALIYFLVKRLNSFTDNHLYHQCLSIISIATMLGFYAGGNYFIVRELSNELFNLDLAPNETIPFGWLFWVFTFIIPVIYLGRGIQQKSSVKIRVGLLLIAAIVFTVRYYYSILAIEIYMSIAGIVLIVIAYGLTRYLKIPKHGFTNIDLGSADAVAKSQIESLFVASTFNSQPADVGNTNFGGGNFGGGGSSGEF